MRNIILILFILSSYLLSGQGRVASGTHESPSYMVDAINKIRMNGAVCGGRQFPAVEAITWDTLLVASASIQAHRMHKYNFFSHVDNHGEDVTHKMDRVGYNWQVAGENLGEGQRNFDQVLEDWMDSPPHCELIMDERMKEMGIYRKERFWVQHFGKRLPENAGRKSIRYEK